MNTRSIKEELQARIEESNPSGMLDLSALFLKRITDREFNILIEYLKKALQNSAIHELRFELNGFSKFRIDQLKDFFACLNIRHLKKLSLRNNYLGFASIDKLVIIGTELKKCDIEDINLDDNYLRALGNRHFSIFIEALLGDLLTQSKIRHLSLKNNHLSQLGNHCLSALINNSEGRNIEKIDLRNNNFDMLDLNLMYEYFEKNLKTMIIEKFIANNLSLTFQTTQEYIYEIYQSSLSNLPNKIAHLAPQQTKNELLNLPRICAALAYTSVYQNQYYLPSKPVNRYILNNDNFISRGLLKLRNNFIFKPIFDFSNKLSFEIKNYGLFNDFFTYKNLEKYQFTSDPLLNRLKSALNNNCLRHQKKFSLKQLSMFALAKHQIDWRHADLNEDLKHEIYENSTLRL